MRSRVLSALLVLCLLLTGCGRRAAPTLLSIGTADRGGSMAPAGKAIAAALTKDGRKVSVSVSTGSAMNVESLAAGNIDLGLVSGDVAHAAYEGQGAYDGQPQSLRAVAAIYSQVSCWIAPQNTHAEYVHDLAGLRLGVGPEDSSTELTARAAADALGLTDQGGALVNCSLENGARQLADGTLDALHAFVGFPSPSLSQLAQAQPCRLLKLTEEELTRILIGNPSYFAVTIPAGTYAGQTEDVTTFGTRCLLCVRADAPEALVYALTRDLYEAAAALAEENPALAEMAQPEFLCRNLSIPLHPGAEKLYVEIGALTPSDVD